MSNLLVSVKKVVKTYGRLRALDGVDVEISAGSFVALLGLNGAGKTTLFQLLAGLIVPDAGTITINGFDMRRDPVSALMGLGIVFQESTIDLDLPVAASLRFHAGLHGMGRTYAEKRIGQELERLGLTDQIHTVGRKLSGGNRRRVELARALLHGPQLLLLDEPTAGLDPAMRRDFLDYVVRLCGERGVGVLWATHLVEETERADQVMVLHRGRIIAAATPATLMEQTGEPSLIQSFLKLTAMDQSGVANAAAESAT